MNAALHQPSIPATCGDIGSASLHAEHALAEARSDLHHAVSRGICESEIDASRRAFRDALTRYVNCTVTEYGL